MLMMDDKNHLMGVWVGGRKSSHDEGPASTGRTYIFMAYRINVILACLEKLKKDNKKHAIDVYTYKPSLREAVFFPPQN